MSEGHDLLLGLIGDNIASSQAPRLHRLAGRQSGLLVRYDLLVPAEAGMAFDALFDDCRRGGYRGLNITYPYKERAARRVEIADPLVRAIGAVNTVLFDGGTPKGFNTDHSGFIAAYRAERGGAGPGTVCLLGAGGVGRAIAFALLALGADELRLVDRDAGKAAALADDLKRAGATVAVAAWARPEAAARGADGVVNCTPVGMNGHAGSPLEAAAMAGAAWAFDAVYTPVRTLFLRDAAQAGLDTLSGYELFFFQGVHAWARFAGAPLDEAALRASLAEPEAGPPARPT